MRQVYSQEAQLFPVIQLIVDIQHIHKIYDSEGSKLEIGDYHVDDSILDMSCRSIGGSKIIKEEFNSFMVMGEHCIVFVVTLT